MYCAKCGKPMDDADLFCASCGHRVGAEFHGSIPPEIPEPAPRKGVNVLSLIGWISAGVGIVGFLLIVLVGLAVYHRVYLYNGYDYTKVLCTLCIIFMLAGVLLMVLGMILGRKKLSKGGKIANIVISCVLITVSLVFSSILISNGVTQSRRRAYPPFGVTSDIPMDRDTYCRIYLKISDVRVTHQGDYAYVTGTISNRGKIQIKNVRVSIRAKDSVGNVVVNGTMYAVDQTNLAPGTSREFTMKIRDEDGRIVSAAAALKLD